MMIRILELLDCHKNYQHISWHKLDFPQIEILSIFSHIYFVEDPQKLEQGIQKHKFLLSYQHIQSSMPLRISYQHHLQNNLVDICLRIGLILGPQIVLQYMLKCILWILLMYLMWDLQSCLQFDSASRIHFLIYNSQDHWGSDQHTCLCYYQLFELGMDQDRLLNYPCSRKQKSQYSLRRIYE